MTAATSKQTVDIHNDNTDMKWKKIAFERGITTRLTPGPDATVAHKDTPMKME